MAIGKLNLKLGIDVSNLEKELGKVERAMSRFGSQMQNIGSTMTQSITLPLLGVGAASLKAFADMEKLENGLIAIMGTSEGAKEELDKLRKVAENPGLALPQVVKASASLQSTGLSADFARETIVQFGNAVARAGEGAEVFDRVTFALSQISSATKITQEDLNQLKEALPEFGNVIKNEFGQTTAEGLRSLNISNQEFIQRTVEALSKLERAKGGLGNAFDNLKDNVTASLAELGKTINESLKVEEAFAKVSEKLNAFVQGFKSLKPEVQSFIVYFGLAVAAIGPAVFIIGKLISTYGALAGISKKVIEGIGKINDAIKYLAANPQILIITASIAAIGAIALYVYDNWKAFTDNFKNIWINIKNSVMEGVANVLKNINYLQKALRLNLFNLDGLTSYQKEQRIVATEFKSIGDTVDSLKGKLASLFTTGAKATGKGGGITAPTLPTEPSATTATGGGGGGSTSPVAAITTETTGITNMLPTLDLLSTKLVSAAANNQRLKETNEDVKNSFIAVEAQMMSFGNTLTSALTAAVDAFSNLAVQGETDMKKMASAALQAARQIVSAYIKEGVAGIVKNILAGPTGKALGPFAIAVAGAAGAGASVLFNTLLNKVSAPKLAEGGLAYGPTMATVGDNRNSRVDPEVIAPLSKLKSMMGDLGMGGVLETRISGNDLIILLNRSQKGLSRIQ